MLLHRSPRLALLMLLSHAAAAFAVYATDLPSRAQSAILIPILLSLLYYLARDALLLLPGSWREILPEREHLSILMQNGSKLAGQATDRTFVSPHFVVLHIRPEGTRRTCARVLFRDALGQEAFRALCVHLRYAQ
jgi:hypothetical protein